MARKPSRSEWHQQNGLWSRSLGSRGLRVRLFQKRRSGQFYRAVWVSGRGSDRRCLQTSDRNEAERLGKELLAALLRNEEIEPSHGLSLAELWCRYSQECVAFLDNSERSRLEAKQHAEILVGFFGNECDVRGLTEQDQIAFTRKRMAGGIIYGDGRVTLPVRTRSVEVDLQLLHTMLRWAVTVRSKSGKRLLDHDPLAGIRRPREKNPKRPVATWERYRATRKAIAALIEHSKSEMSKHKWMKLDLALTLAEATGRRLGSIRQLSWDDIDFVRSTIRWRAETDKKGKLWIIPIPASLCDELRAYRVRMGGAFGGLLFPSDQDPNRAVSRDAFGHWLAEAEMKAGLEKLDGSLWHAYRRAWATSRKHLPVVDVAAAGGWSDISTLLKCYQHADDETLLQVMAHPKKITEAARTG